MKIRFLHPATAHLSFVAGDEIHMEDPSSALLSLLLAVRADGEHVARVISSSEDDEEIADLEQDPEMAVTGRNGRRSRRSPFISR